MTDVAHSTMAGSNLHENKGVSSATDNTVATAVSGATVWAKLTASNLTGTGNPFGAQLLHVSDHKNSGTGGGTATQGAWTTRVLNTSVTNEITSASLSSNVVSLPSGTYDAQAWAAFGQQYGAKLRLRNTSDGTTLVVGQNVYSLPYIIIDSTPNYIYPITEASLRGRFTLTGTKNVELQYYVNGTSISDSLGGADSTGEVEVYADLRIWKVV